MHSWRVFPIPLHEIKYLILEWWMINLNRTFQYLLLPKTILFSFCFKLNGQIEIVFDCYSFDISMYFVRFVCRNFRCVSWWVIHFDEMRISIEVAHLKNMVFPLRFRTMLQEMFEQNSVTSSNLIVSGIQFVIMSHTLNIFGFWVNI